ncbi:12147_t:CDS:1 [Cetraspora pellucida]|uniref:12147_t:CDS:1 n=1 Tax=Cetraspora pellucida TaxID=1433469 RepID=A0A9N9EY51_9GLOM|nr:12147_t:CDS:1 [Cetraspora pellucida]
MIKLTLNLFLIILFSCLLTSSIVVDGFHRPPKPHKPPKPHEPCTIVPIPTTTSMPTKTVTTTEFTLVECETTPPPVVTCPSTPIVSGNTAYISCTEYSTECVTTL